jgi:hypothetical protein
MKPRSASRASFIVASLALPVWVIILLESTMFLSDDFNPAGALVWPGFSLLVAIPFGWVVGYVVSPAIYRKCDNSRPYRCAVAVLVHAAVCVVLAVSYWIIEYVLPRASPLLALAYPFAFAIVCAPMLAVPSLIGTLVYACRSVPLKATGG